jgi:dipeptidyl aminopeptidase/acylaminoacyl peptidase
VSRYTAEKSASGWTWRRQSLTGEHAKNIQNFVLSEDGKTIVYQYSTASKLPQIYRAQLDGTTIISPAQITKLNEKLVTGRIFAKTEVIRWKGSQDEEVEGILYYPANYEAGKKYPVITAIHGGPTGCVGRQLGLPRQSSDAAWRIRAAAELSRKRQLRAEVGGIDLLRQVLRPGDAGHQYGRRLFNFQGDG